MSKEMKVNPKAKPPSSVWDLDRDGISFSLLSNLIGCKERSRIKLVEGLSSADFSYPIEFGNMFHDCMEFNNESLPTLKARLSKRGKRIMERHSMTPKGREEVFKLVEIIMVYWKNYLNHWKVVDSGITWLHPEHQFQVEYTADTYRPITLRGKIDGVIQREGNPWLIENKTKATIPSNMLDTLPHNLQTMMYSLASEIETGDRIHGILWNGIKRPTIKQTKKETFEEYLRRLDEDMQERPAHYFIRYECRFDTQDVPLWEQYTFKPLIVSVIEWWDSIKKNPHDPYTVDRRDPEAVEALLRRIESSGGKGCVVTADDVPRVRKAPNPHHYERPIGAFDPMSFGLDEYFDYMVSGVRGSLQRVTTMFPELDEE